MNALEAVDPVLYGCGAPVGDFLLQALARLWADFAVHPDVGSVFKRTVFQLAVEAVQNLLQVRDHPPATQVYSLLEHFVGELIG